jgi:hypothetical protein
MGNINIKLECIKCGMQKEFEEEFNGSESFVEQSTVEFINMKTKGHFIQNHIDDESKVVMTAKVEGEYEDKYEVDLEPIEDEEKREYLKEKYHSDQEDEEDEYNEENLEE